MQGAGTRRTEGALSLRLSDTERARPSAGTLTNTSPLHPSGQNSGVSVTGTVETFVSQQPRTRVEPASGCAVQTSQGARGGLDHPLIVAGESGVGRPGRQRDSEPTWLGNRDSRHLFIRGKGRHWPAAAPHRGGARLTK